jgi:hypothetical protein
MGRVDPKVVLRDLLNDEFDVGNVAGTSSVDIRTGWRDDRLDNLQVTASNDDESARSDTGYTGLNSSRRRGTIQANIWADERVVSANPKKVVEDTRDEVDDVLSEFGSEIADYSFTSGINPSNYSYLSYLGSTYLPEEPDNDEEPIVYRYLVNVGYEYLREL